MLPKSSKKVAKKFYCEKCDYVTSRKSNYDKHVLTRKHNMLPNAAEKVATFFDCDCGKSFSHRQSFFRHSKSCDMWIENEDIYVQKSVPKSSGVKDVDYKHLMHELVNQNKQIIKQGEQIASLMPSISSTTNKTVNNINITNNVNMNVFLNDQCKDAYNLIDFINSLQLHMTDLVNTGKLGFVESMTGILVNALNDIEVTKRPIHCSDIEREVLYVKDNNAWERDAQTKNHMMRAIEHLKHNNLKQLGEWTENNPEFVIQNHEKNSEYMEIVGNCIGGEDERKQKQNMNKIIKNVAKEVYIEPDK